MEWEEVGKGRHSESVCMERKQGTWERPHHDRKSLEYKPDSVTRPKNLGEVMVLTQAGCR